MNGDKRCPCGEMEGHKDSASPYLSRTCGTLCGENGRGSGGSLKDVVQLSRSFSSEPVSCADASCSRVTTCVEDKELVENRSQRRIRSIDQSPVGSFGLGYLRSVTSTRA